MTYSVFANLKDMEDWCYNNQDIVKRLCKKEYTDLTLKHVYFDCKHVHYHFSNNEVVTVCFHNFIEVY